MELSELTDEQRELLRTIGDPTDIVLEGDELDTMDELVQKGLFANRSDGKWDLTEQGEDLYEELVE